MAEKRKRADDETTGSRHADSSKKRKSNGFQVGPDNLPDGTYKRKAQKIKQTLIERASIKKEYAKLKRQGKVPDEPEAIPQPASAALETGHPKSDDEHDDPREAITARHPDRQNMVDQPPTDAQDQDEEAKAPLPRRKRKVKQVPFQREYEQAQRRKAEAEQRRQAREEADRQRQGKLEERERFRRAMAKARSGGPNGQRKLGRESKVLLEKVKRMVDDRG